MCAGQADSVKGGRGEQQLPEREDIQSSLAHLMPQILWEAEPDGRCTFVNHQWCEYTGLSPEAGLDAGCVSVIHPDDRAIYRQQWEQASRVGAAFEALCRLHDGHGGYQWFLCHAIPRREDGREIISWVVSATNVHKIVQAQDAIDHGENRFRLLAETVPLVVWMAAPDGGVSYFNGHWSAYTGTAETQSRGWGWLEAVHHEDRGATVDRWTTAIAERVPFEIEFRLFRLRDHSYRWHLVRGSPLCDDAGAIQRWVGTMTDIDDRRQEATLLEQLVRERTDALEKTNAHLEEFATVASHDLQEPLRKIQAFGNRLHARCASALDDQGKEYLDRIIKSAVRMRTLINDTLTFAKITVNTRDLDVVDLNCIARDVLSDLESLLQDNGGTVELGDLPAIEADSVQVRLLFQNLIGNALKFHRAGVAPVVRISAQRVPAVQVRNAPVGPEWNEISVSDNGIGFDEIHVERIFQVFQRLHGRSHYEGTGMGLAICRKIVEWHKGEITARSTPGEGSVFLVRLPVYGDDRGRKAVESRTRT